MSQVLSPALAVELITYLSKRHSAVRADGFDAVAKPRLIMSHGLYRYSGDPRSDSIDLAAVERLGYRAFVWIRKNAVIAVDCITKPEVSSYRIHFGDIALSWLHEVRLLRKRKQLLYQEYEVRWLLVQAHHFMLFWLAFPSGNPTADLFLQTDEEFSARRRRRFFGKSEAEALIREAIVKYNEMHVRQTEVLTRATDKN